MSFANRPKLTPTCDKACHKTLSCNSNYFSYSTAIAFLVSLAVADPRTCLAGRFRYSDSALNRSGSEFGPGIFAGARVGARFSSGFWIYTNTNTVGIKLISFPFCLASVLAWYRKELNKLKPQGAPCQLLDSGTWVTQLVQSCEGKYHPCCTGNLQNPIFIALLSLQLSLRSHCGSIRNIDILSPRKWQTSR